MLLRYNDKRHSYHLDRDDGQGLVRCKGVTTVAKIPDDTYNLERWKARQLAIGLSREPHLIDSVAAHHTDKGKLDELCEAALTAAGSGRAAEHGTTVHRITDRVDTADPMQETALYKRVRAQWLALLDGAGLDVIPELVERVVVYPEHRICGKFDRFVRNRATGGVHCLDLKTGGVDYPHSMAVQLAMYANAPLIAGAWEGLDGETDIFEPPPANMDRTTAYIVHMPPDDAAGVYALDIALGWRAVERCVFPTLKWRKVPASKLLRPIV